MSPDRDRPSVSGSISGVSGGMAAIGVGIRQQAIYLTVEIASGDPAALERVAQQIRFDPLESPVSAVGRDFPGLIGRDAEVALAREALRARRSIAVFGDEGIGKSVLLRHLARRAGDGYPRGVARIATAGNRWQDIGQDIVKAFFRAELPIYLGPTQLGRVLAHLDALVLLDDVDPQADIGELFALLEEASFVVASTERLLGGETRAVHLEGLDAAASAILIGETLANAGSSASVDPAVAARIGTALGGRPAEIIRIVEDAQRRHLDLAALAAELEAGAGHADAATLARLDPPDAAIVDAVAALDGVPVGTEHVAVVAAGGSADLVDELVRQRVLRAASPQVRLDPGLAAAQLSLAADADEIRSRFLDHFITWAAHGATSAVAVAEESRAILYLIDWAAATGRLTEVRALAAATEGAFALAGRWGAWAQVTSRRLWAARELGDQAEAAIALNQIGVQALGEDAVPRAREAFADARAAAVKAGNVRIAATATHNLQIVDGLLLAGRVERSERERDPGRQQAAAAAAPAHVSRLLVLLAVAGLLGLAAVLYLLLNGGRALAIEPAAHTFQQAVVRAGGEEFAFTVTNRTGTTLLGLDATPTGPGFDQFVFSGDCLGANLAVGQSCTIVVLFAPDRPGDASATLTIAARDGTVVSASMLGVAVEPSPSPILTDSPPPPPSEIPSQPPTARADLAIRAFAPTDAPSVDNVALVPVEVVIVNAGKGEAGVFPIVITADGKPVPFDVPGEDPENLVTRAPLAPLASVTYRGTVRLDAATRLDEVRLVVKADSCARDPNPGDACRVDESNERNNSYPLQAVDLQVANLVLGVPTEHYPSDDVDPPWLEVPLAFDLRNAGIEPAGSFWIAGFAGRIRATLQLDGLEIDPARQLPQVRGLPSDDGFMVKGVASIPLFSRESELTIVVGCPPGSEPCQLPEIAFANNEASAAIPQPSPPPVP